MTKNQIEYLKLRETQRANLVQEDLTRSRDSRSYEIGLGTLAESQRHNRATEEQARVSLDETVRHNLAGETLTRGNLDESIRHNQAVEAEASRHNKVGESYNERALKESQRHNVAQEGISRSQVGASYANINLGYSQLGETTRANIARETENTRSNVAREQENLRHNESTEAINMYRNRADSSYQKNSLKQGDKRLRLDTWKTVFEGADTVFKGIRNVVPLWLK
nr:hypothetical protein [Otarine picobirnavirus]